MEDKLILNLNQSLKKGFIDKNLTNESNLTPKLLVKNKNQNVLTSIINELEKCYSFFISVAFITESGLASLKAIFNDLNHKGIKGKLITSNSVSYTHLRAHETTE